MKTPSARVQTALLLAAGTGSRLKPLTQNAPKCLTEVNGQSFIQRMVHALQLNGIQRLIVVVGHLDRCIRDSLDEVQTDIQIEYVVNAEYRSTNNIYSLWLARERLQEPFLLLECDLIFDPEMLRALLEPDSIAISHRLPWMNGSTVSLDENDQVTAFHIGPASFGIGTTFKTVNIYSFSAATWEQIHNRLKQHINKGQRFSYYEQVLAELVAERQLRLRGVFVNPQRWYEVDTMEDLHQAERMFHPDGELFTPDNSLSALYAEN